MNLTGKATGMVSAEINRTVYEAFQVCVSCELVRTCMNPLRECQHVCDSAA